MYPCPDPEAMPPRALSESLKPKDVAERLACLRTIAVEAREMAQRAEAIGALSKVESLLYLARYYEAEEARFARETSGP